MPDRTYRINELTVPVTRKEQDLSIHLSREIKIPVDKISGLKIIRKSLDCRRGHAYWKYNLEFNTSKPPRSSSVRSVDADVPESSREEPIIRLPEQVHIVGCGPAGMFAALGLGRKGYRVHVYEQGADVENRKKDISGFVNNNHLNCYSNILYGEGGAGTFSDGKLTCRTSNTYTRQVLEILISCGAPAEIRYLAKPHLGSDCLPRIVSRLRLLAIESGVEFHFNTEVTGIEIYKGCVKSLLMGDVRAGAEAIVLAAGNSARSLFESLLKNGAALEPKDFAVGVRLEHPQDFINLRQLGKSIDPALVGNSEYFFSYKNDPCRAYTFCMCPGGYIVPCADSRDGLFTNGMSKSGRNGKFGNAALVSPVQIGNSIGDSENIGGRDPLAGLAYQKKIENIGYEMAGGDFSFPSQTMESYLAGKTDRCLPDTSFSRPISPVDFNEMFEEQINKSLKQAIISIDKKMPGFIKYGHMIGPETRTSSPVRILRESRSLESINTQGLYPVGEGSGYAGGIVSSAADGLKLAAGVKSIK